MARPCDSEKLARLRPPALELWGLSLLLCLYSCGNPQSEAPPTGTPDVGRQVDAADPQKDRSEQRRFSPTAMATVPLRTPSPQQPIAGAPVRADLSEQAASATASADQEAWSKWYEAARESPDVSVRLQALEMWAQKPGDFIAPVTYGLVDEDEQVRDRAQALYTQQHEREAAAAAPVDQATQEP